ncbi:MAG: hypothetical protein HYZ75_00470 [Elusimicrobia bacterium]|nr:hypothetical protein [Elusimicrobiota bacterium]
MKQDQGPETKRLTADLLALVRQFIPRHDGTDVVWGFWLREGRSWSRVTARRYRGTYFIAGGDAETITHPERGHGEYPENPERLRSWLHGLRLWKAEAARDPVGAQADLLRRLPLSMRRGVLLRRDVKALLPDWLPLERELSSSERIAILEILDREDPGPIVEMTAAKFFNYCRAAYQANPRTFQSQGFKRGLAGRDYYKRYADGRDGGLQALEPRSTEAFRRWFDSEERSGAHPWEIYRGGNSTHIDLSVGRHPAGGWSVALAAFSSSRLVETCRIALALDKARLPFCLAHRESYKKRLLEEDWVGVVPEDSEIRYAWHDFPREWDVADCIRLQWIFEANPGRNRALRSKLRHLISWLPERMSAHPLRIALPGVERSRNPAPAAPGPRQT